MIFSWPYLAAGRNFSRGVPVPAMRDAAERPEGVRAVTLKLVGADEETICRAFKLLESKEAYEKMSRACERIAYILEKGSFEPWEAV